MEFQQNTGYSYREFAELAQNKIQNLLAVMKREDMIEWLCWSDPNGVYKDKDSLMEFGNIMSREEAMEIILRQTKKIAAWKNGDTDLGIVNVDTLNKSINCQIVGYTDFANR